MRRYFWVAVQVPLRPPLTVPDMLLPLTVPVYVALPTAKLT
jgi:hypothetical protein